MMQLEQCKCMVDESSMSICRGSTTFTDLKNHLQPINEEEPEKFDQPNPANKVREYRDTYFVFCAC